MFRLNPFPCIQSPASVLAFGTYPISSTQDRILDLYADVHIFSVSIFSDPIENPFQAFFEAGGAQGTAIGALGGTAAASDAISSGAISAVGDTRRKILTASPIHSTDEAPFPQDRTTVCGEYPVHNFSGLGAIMEINFGKTVNLGGVYAPYITLTMSNGMSNTVGAFITGSISFTDLGQIPIYALSLGLVVGSVSVKERYSDIVMSSLQASEGAVVTLRPAQGKTFSGFKDVTDVYVGGVKAVFVKPTDSRSPISVTVPKGAQSGLITFLSKTVAGVNKFYSPDELRIV